MRSSARASWWIEDLTMRKIQRSMQGNELILSVNGQQVLSMAEELQEDCLLITAGGAVSSDVVHDFQDELVALATVGKDIRLDLAAVTYLSNAAMQALLQVQQQMDSMERGSLTLIHVPKEILTDFSRIGLDELLMIED